MGSPGVKLRDSVSKQKGGKPLRMAAESDLYLHKLMHSYAYTCTPVTAPTPERGSAAYTLSCLDTPEDTI